MSKTMDVALLVNAVVDLIIAVRRIAPEVTPENIEQKVAERQSEIDALHEEINK